MRSIKIKQQETEYQYKTKPPSVAILFVKTLTNSCFLLNSMDLTKSM